MAAVVQGMDESVVNGAQSFYVYDFGLNQTAFGVNTGSLVPDVSRKVWLIGLVNSAPALACAVLGCWLTEPLNNLMGRRGVIFLSCFIAAGTYPLLAF